MKCYNMAVRLLDNESLFYYGVQIFLVVKLKCGFEYGKEE